jgi:spectinomycin phosphotransferase
VYTPPTSPTDREVLDAVRRYWMPRAAAVRYVPKGFGAHHWQVVDEHGPVLFATHDQVGDPQGQDLPASGTAASRWPPSRFVRAYAATIELARAGVPGVLAPVPAAGGQAVVPLAAGVLSVTPWCEGDSPTEEEGNRPLHLARVREIVGALHAAAVPTGIPIWSPRDGRVEVDAVIERARDPWTRGPFGELARETILASAEGLRTVGARFDRLAGVARSARENWVPTHGEVHHRNRMLTGPDGSASPDGDVLLVDWESLALAPPERDSRDLPPSAREGLGEDPAMLEMFALEWTLSELHEYAHWFQGPHDGSADDRVALDGLEEELVPYRR